LVAFGSCATAFQGYEVASDEQCNLFSPVEKLTACWHTCRPCLRFSYSGFVACLRRHLDRPLLYLDLKRMTSTFAVPALVTWSDFAAAVCSSWHAAASLDFEVA